MLEAACGTGAYLAHLCKWYDVTGFDVSKSMLTVAAERVPEVKTFCSDMSDFTVDSQYDALVCLFSSIGYIHTEEALKRAAKCFAEAVRPGGCLVVEPWVAPEDFKPGTPTQHTFESDDLKLCRSVVSRRDGDMAVLDFHWLVTPQNSDVEYFVDRHKLWLCEHGLIKQTFDNAGFECSWSKAGLMKERGLLVGTRQRA